MEEESTQWINISDVMSALMMIFMFLSIAFIYELQNSRKTFQKKLNTALHKEFDRDLEVWKAEITSDNIFRFNAPFKEGNSQVPDAYAKTLSNFFPRYIKVLTVQQFSDNINELRVEGHTSYGWASLSTRNEIYIKNIKLSQLRASNVLEFCYSLNNEIVVDNKDWLETHFRGNGMAYSHLIYKSGEVAKYFELNRVSEQDEERSRRVEFKVDIK